MIKNRSKIVPWYDNHMNFARYKNANDDDKEHEHNMEMQCELLSRSLVWTDFVMQGNVQMIYKYYKYSIYHAFI